MPLLKYNQAVIGKRLDPIVRYSIKGACLSMWIALRLPKHDILFPTLLIQDN